MRRCTSRCWLRRLRVCFSSRWVCRSISSWCDRVGERRMKIKFSLALLMLVLACVSVCAQRRSSFAQSTPPASLQELVNNAAHAALAKFADKKLAENQLSITLIDLRDPQHPATASFRGNERIYPASVVKLFYLGAVHRWLEDKKIQE